MPPDMSVAEAIKTQRQLRGWSIRDLAARADLDHTMISRIERGMRSADNRFTLAAIAEALGCSTADLTGGVAVSKDRQLAAAQAAAGGILAALVETDLEDPATVKARPLAEVARDAELIWDLRLRCDYGQAAALVPRVLRECHAHTHGKDRVAALDLFAKTADATGFILRYIGYPAEAYLAAQRTRDAARASGDPVLLGLAAWSLGHAATGCGAHTRALRIATAAVDEFAGDAPEMLGSLQLLAAFSSFALGNRDDARAWADQASRIAERTGDTHTLGLGFGGTNLNVWLISMEVDGGEPGKAVEIAQRTHPDVLYVSRRASFYIDVARAHTRLGQDVQALRMLRAGERLAPQRIRASSLVRETVRGMAQRGVAGVGGLAERVGVA